MATTPTKPIKSSKWTHFTAPTWAKEAVEKVESFVNNVEQEVKKEFTEAPKTEPVVAPKVETTVSPIVTPVTTVVTPPTTK
jgi:hypothetical protein